MPGSETAPPRSLRVLHVDDEPMNRRVVQEILDAFGHCAVGVCSGEEALEQLRRQNFDAVLMDIHMPQMDGLEVIRRMRNSLGRESETPVIACTADTVTRRPEDYLALGFSDFVSKPIRIAALITAIVHAASWRPALDERWAV